MLTYKKITLGLLLAFIATSGLLLFSKSALALTRTDYDDPPATYRIIGNVDDGVIEATYPGGVKVTFRDSNPTDSNRNYKPTGGGVCNLSGDNNGINRTGGLSGGSYQGNIVNVGDSVGPGGRCIVDVDAPIQISIIGASTSGTITCDPAKDGPTCICTGNPGTGLVCTMPDPASTVSDDNSCEGKNNTGLEWLFCGVLRTFDQMVETFVGTVESLLNFNTKENLNDNVKQAWTVFKNVATALLVIVMLVMVISQAISAGPFDAYTVRKILPRLVAAVILMQISWYLFSWTIEAANNAGQGIADLMYAPFGGADQLNLDKQIGRLGELAPGITVGTLFATIVATTLLSGITIFGVMLIALSVVISLLIGLVVLIFRQMLIILCMILVPIALAAWILPGTQRYWKLWSDTFMKLLIMFPLIMALIAAGRIFAWVAGNPPAGDNAGLAIISVLIIFIGYFGPFWFIPKTFQWGGQVLGNLAGIVNDRGRGIIDRPRRYALEGAKANRQQRALDRAERLGENKTAGVRRFADSLLAGKYNYSLKPTARERRFEGTKATGREAAEKAVAQAIIGSDYERLNHQEKLAVLETLAQGNDHLATGLSGKHPAMQRFALDQLAAYGDWDKISDLRDRNAVDRRTWEMFVAKNIGAIHQKAPHLSPLKSDLSKSISAEDLVNVHGEEIDELHRQYFGGAVRDPATGALRTITDPADLQRHQQSIHAVVDTAIRNPNINGRLTPEAREKLTAIQDSKPDTPIVRINPPTRQGGQYTVDLPSDLSNPDAQRSVRAVLAAGKGASQAASRTLANRVAVAPLGSPEEEYFRKTLDEFRSRAATSPKAAAIHDQLLKDLQGSLAQIPQEAESRALASGLSAPNIAATVQAAQQRNTQKLNRLNSLGEGTPIGPVGQPTGGNPGQPQP